MTLSTPAGYSTSNLVYQEGFDGTALNTAWHKYITSKAANGSPWNSYNGGSGPGGQFEAEFDMPGQVAVHDGVLDITSSKTPIVGMNQGTVMTHPITSGTVSSYGNFEFNGGLLQVSMKQPVGNGAWPGIWLMPGSGSSGGDNYEIDIQEGGYTGKGPANQAFQWHLHTPGGDVGGVVDTGVDLTADFHTYAIDWKPGQSITWYLDGKQMAQVTSAQLPIPNQPMELILDSQWANSQAAGWHSTVDGSTPQTSHMLVDGVQLYQQPVATSNTVLSGGGAANSQSTTVPALVISQFFGAPPTQAHLSELATFDTSQLAAYTRMGVAQPLLGPYEALGAGFSDTVVFRNKYAGLSDPSFVTKAYIDVFERQPTSAQAQHFNDQLVATENLYISTGQSIGSADWHARGAVLGQMLGVAVVSEPSQHPYLDKASTFLHAAALGQATYGDPLALV